MIMQKILKNTHHSNDDILQLQKIKSENSIKQINKLHKALSTLEEKCNQQIANKYLKGFLENKGVETYTEYIDSLI